MSDEKHEFDRGAKQKEKVIACRRTGQLFDLAECPRCPYCFGDDADVASRDTLSFCDFHPGVDAVSFGFPGNDDRTRHG
jgi:hypothetical protein